MKKNRIWSVKMYENKVVPSQKMIEAERPCLNLWISESYPRSGLRRTIRALHLYSATRKISLSFGERPLTSYPWLTPQACTGLATCKFHRPFRLINEFLSICHMATFTGDFCYRRISPSSRQNALLALPLSYQLPHWYPLGLLLHRRRLLLHPEVPCF